MTSEECNQESVYNEMFAYRYSDKDPDYVETTSKPLPPSPCVANYFVRPKRNFEPNRGDSNRGGRGRWRGGNHGDNRGEGRNYGNRDGRHGYHGNQGNSGYNRDRNGGYRDSNGGHRGKSNRYQPY